MNSAILPIRQPLLLSYSLHCASTRTFSVVVIRLVSMLLGLVDNPFLSRNFLFASAIRRLVYAPTLPVIEAEHSEGLEAEGLEAEAVVECLLEGVAAVVECRHCCCCC
jgi:hypothetical protein